MNSVVYKTAACRTVGELQGLRQRSARFGSRAMKCFCGFVVAYASLPKAQPGSLIAIGGNMSLACHVSGLLHIFHRCGLLTLAKMLMLVLAPACQHQGMLSPTDINILVRK